MQAIVNAVAGFSVLGTGFLVSDFELRISDLILNYVI